MGKKKELEFANFTLKFGLDGNLLDYAEEIVLPAFFDEKLERSFGKTTYFLRNVQLLVLDGVNKLTI